METLEQSGWIMAHVAMGIGLAACTGLRAFLPLLVVGLAGKIGWVPMSEAYAWLASWPALLLFSAAVVVEVLADKFPFVDNVLDSVQTIVKPVAGALVMATVVDEWAPLYVTVVGIVTGGAVAGAVHVAKAKLRLASSVATAGIGNPLLSVSEDAGAAAGSILALLVPWLVVAMLLVGAVLVWLVFRRLRRPPETASLAR